MGQALNLRRVHTIVRNRVVARNPAMKINVGTSGEYWIQGGQVYGGEGSKPLADADIPDGFWDYLMAHCSDEALGDVGILKRKLEKEIEREQGAKEPEPEPPKAEAKEEPVKPAKPKAKPKTVKSAKKQETVKENGDDSTTTRDAKPRDNTSNVDRDNAG